MRRGVHCVSMPSRIPLVQVEDEHPGAVEQRGFRVPVTLADAAKVRLSKQGLQAAGAAQSLTAGQPKGHQGAGLGQSLSGQVTIGKPKWLQGVLDSSAQQQQLVPQQSLLAVLPPPPCLLLPLPPSQQPSSALWGSADGGPQGNGVGHMPGQKHSSEPWAPHHTPSGPPGIWQGGGLPAPPPQDMQQSLLPQQLPSHIQLPPPPQQGRLQQPVKKEIRLPAQSQQGRGAGQQQGRGGGEQQGEGAAEPGVQDAAQVEAAIVRNLCLELMHVVRSGTINALFGGSPSVVEVQLEAWKLRAAERNARQLIKVGPRAVPQSVSVSGCRSSCHTSQNSLLFFALLAAAHEELAAAGHETETESLLCGQ